MMVRWFFFCELLILGWAVMDVCADSGLLEMINGYDDDVGEVRR
jgi:hypothetical protein